MKTKHTQGEWVIQEKEEYFVRRVTDEKGSLIAKVFGDEGGGVDANAKLIAGAPELLGALNQFLEDAEDGKILQATINKAVKAIEKATE